jgi:DNA replication ATP-dependent helicase Dna2
MGKSVLFTSYTHSAIDNLLLKLLALKIDFLRIGTHGKVHPQIRDVIVKQRENIKNVADLASLYENTKVVASTVLGMNQ